MADRLDIVESLTPGPRGDPLPSGRPPVGGSGPVPPALGTLRGGELVRALEQRFGAVAAGVEVAGVTLTLLRPPSAEALISEEDFDRDERLPYWAELWPSAVALARRLASERGQGRALLELGSGVGLVAAVAGRAGYRVTASDYYEDALHFTRANVWRTLRHEPTTRLLDWRTLPEDIAVFDRVVAADVLYERPYGPLVAAAIARTLAPGGEATVADPGRVGARPFLDACPAAGLRVTRTDTVADSAGVREITLYTLHHSEQDAETPQAARRWRARRRSSPYRTTSRASKDSVAPG